MGELWNGRRHNWHTHSFRNVKPRSRAAVAAEARYNESLTHSAGGDTAALNRLVEAHMRNYPGGIDDNHRREAKREALDQAHEDKVEAQIEKGRLR